MHFCQTTRPITKFGTLTTYQQIVDACAKVGKNTTHQTCSNRIFPQIAAVHLIASSNPNF